MEVTKTELIMLGTGNATTTRCYNTCFILKTKETILLVDAGGGNGILNQLEKVNLPIDNIHEMFVTHAHTDHILGAVWMIRIIAQRAANGHYTGKFHVYSHDKVLLVLDQICRMTLPASIITAINKHIEFHEVKNGDSLRLGDLHLQCFDIASTKENSMVSVLRYPMDNPWFVLETNRIMIRIVLMWKELIGCCARLFVCTKTVSVLNLTKNIIAPHWMQAGWPNN